MAGESAIIRTSGHLGAVRRQGRRLRRPAGKLGPMLCIATLCWCIAACASNPAPAGELAKTITPIPPTPTVSPTPAPFGVRVTLTGDTEQIEEWAEFVPQHWVPPSEFAALYELEIRGVETPMEKVCLYVGSAATLRVLHARLDVFVSFTNLATGEIIYGPILFGGFDGEEDEIDCPASRQVDPSYVQLHPEITEYLGPDVVDFAEWLNANVLPTLKESISLPVRSGMPLPEDLARIDRENVSGLIEIADWYEPGGEITAMAFSPGGEFLASGTESGIVNYWSLLNGATIDSLPGKRVDGLAFSRSGKWLILSRRGQGTQALQVDGARMVGQLTNADLNVFALNPRGDILAAAVDGYQQIGFWRLDEDKNTMGMIGGVESDHMIQDLAFAEDGNRLIAATGDDIQLWDMDAIIVSMQKLGDEKLLVQNDGLLKTLRIQSDDWEANSFQSIAYRSEGSILAAASFDGRVHLWHTGEDLPFLTLTPEGGYGLKMMFISGGQILVLGMEDRDIELWAVPEGTLLARLESRLERINCMSIDPSGTLLAAGGPGGLIRLWGIPKESK